MSQVSAFVFLIDKSDVPQKQASIFEPGPFCGHGSSRGWVPSLWVLIFGFSMKGHFVGSGIAVLLHSQLSIWPRLHVDGTWFGMVRQHPDKPVLS